MKKRYIYSLLFAIPGFFLAGIMSFFALGAILGILWLFVFGDNPWPASPDTILAILFGLTFLIVWITLIRIGYATGMKLEQDPALHWAHILISGGLTLLLILFIILQQWSVGNLGQKTDELLCNEFCVQRGYSGSGMPPLDSGDRTCSCYDASGNEALKIPVDSIPTGLPK